MLLFAYVLSQRFARASIAVLPFSSCSIGIMEVVMADNDSNNIGWFLAGLGLGALVGVLYAPKSGKETRDSIVQGALEGREYVTNRGRQAGEQVGQWVDKGRDV